MTNDKYSHLSLDLALFKDGIDVGQAMADKIISGFTLKLLSPDVTREITAIVVEDVESKCMKARTAGVPDETIAEWRQWYEVGYSLRIEPAFGKAIADHTFSRDIAGSVAN